MKLVQADLSPISDALFKNIEQNISLNDENPFVIYLEGGHFDPRYPISDFSTNSLRFSLDLANNLILRYRKKVKVVLGILVNNIGIDCGTDICLIDSSQIKAEITIPHELESILNKYTIVKKEKLIISNEINLKNRGIKVLKRKLDTLIAEQIIYLEEDNGITKIYHSDDYQGFLLAETDFDKWMVKCPTIMGQHYADIFMKLHRRFLHAKDFILVDFSEIFDKQKVICGKKACFSVFLDTNLKMNSNKIINAFLWDNDGDRYNIES